MKRVLYIILLGIFFSCQGQNKNAITFMTSIGDGYYSIPNKLEGQLILPDYQNYKSKNDSIYLEKILYADDENDCIFIIGNIMGSKTSLLLALQKNEEKPIIYVEQIGLIDTIEKINMNNCLFFKLNNTYSDVCSERKVLCIYVLDHFKVYKSFEGIEKEEYFNTGDPLCQEGFSYVQNFELKLDGNDIILNAKKESTNGDIEHSRYQFKNHQFK